MQQRLRHLGWRHWLCWLLLWGLMPASATLRVATAQWPGFTTATGQGAYFELLQLVLAEPVTVDIMPYTRAVLTTERQQAEVVFAVTPHDSTLLGLSMDPIDFDEVVAVFRPTAALKIALQQRRFSNLRLSWRQGYNYGVALGLPAQGFEALSIEQGLELVLHQRLDLFLVERSELDSFTPQQLLQSGLAVEHLAFVPIYVGFAPSSRGLQLQRQWNQRWQQLRETGELHRFYQHHDGMLAPDPRQPTKPASPQPASGPRS